MEVSELHFLVSSSQFRTGRYNELFLKNVDVFKFVLNISIVILSD